MSNTKSKVALVTGGAKRIGQAIALSLAAQGYSIALHYYTSKAAAEKTAQAIKNLNVDCQIFPADLTDLQSTQNFVKRVFTHYSKIDVLVNNASLFQPSTLKKGDLKQFENDMAVHVRVPFLLISQFAKRYKAGNIINILDTRISDAKAPRFSYLLAKKALAELTTMAALELAPAIRINGIAPGLILAPEGEKQSYLQRLTQRIPLRKKGELQHITQSIEFLLNNDFLTGQIIYVDGGEHLI